MEGKILNQTGVGPEVSVEIPALVARSLPDRCPYCSGRYDLGWALGDYREAVAYCEKGHDYVVQLSEEMVAEVQQLAASAGAR